MSKNEYIVISDFRALPCIAAMNMAIRFSKNRNITFVVSKRFLSAEDYGQYFHPIYKIIKLKIISVFYKLIYVEKNSDSALSQSDELGVISSLQSITCDSNASEVTYPSLFAKLSELALGSKEIFKCITSVNLPDRVFVFNGRTASSYPLVRSCFDQNITVAYYEYASNHYSGYRLYPYPPHSTTRLGEDVVRFRSICLRPIPEIYLRGKQWGQAKLANAYTKHYQESAKINYDVVVFLGSDHEYTCLDADLSGFKYIGNVGLVKAVIDKYSENYSIAVRAHPNQVNDKSYKLTLASISDLCNEFNLGFYGPDSKISSYELIKNSSIVAVELSSIASDAILLGKNVEIFGDLDLRVILSHTSAFQLLDKNYLPVHVREIMSLYEDLFFVKFNYFERLFCRILSSFEWQILRASSPSKSQLKN
jgi:hypothetical protein